MCAIGAFSVVLVGSDPLLVGSPKGKRASMKVSALPVGPKLDLAGSSAHCMPLPVGSKSAQKSSRRPKWVAVLALLSFIRVDGEQDPTPPQ